MFLKGLSGLDDGAAAPGISSVDCPMAIRYVGAVLAARIPHAFVLVVLLSACAELLAQQPAAPAARPANQPPPPGGPPTTGDIVEVVGCVTAGAGNTWQLTRASTPVRSATQSTTTDAVKKAGGTPLGTGQIRLIGAGPFEVPSHKGHKVVAKGALVKEASETRLNVTSFRRLSEGCSK